MIAIRKLFTTALMLICCATKPETTNALLFLSKLLGLSFDYNQGYGVAFSFGNSSIPNGTCAAELETIRQAIYPVYGTELVLETKWTLNDLFNIDPLLASFSNLFSIFNGNRVRRLGDKDKNQRKLVSCAVYSCVYVNSKPQLRVMVGCSSTCQGRRELSNGDEEKYGNRVNEDHESNSERELETLQYGSRSNYLPFYGNVTALSFYTYANETIVGPCKDIILNMKYVLIPITLS
jgi:hypothetical protein